MVLFGTGVVMAPRKSHLKSRNGCFTCKRRRVKCDESGPPCTNCKIRGTECSFPTRASSSQASRSPAFDMSDTTTPVAMSSARHIPELRLMHYWSTRTYSSMHSEIADDAEVWQNTIPEVGLKYDFLLNSMFALTAFHLAHDFPDQAQQHICTALEYQNLAFAKFRQELNGSPDEVEHHAALLYCSLILMVLALASSTQPALRTSMIDNTLAHFEFHRGLTVVMLKRVECMKENRLFQKVPDMMRLPNKGCNPGVARAMELMRKMNDSRGQTANDEGYESPGVSARPLSDERIHLACKNAIWWIEYLFSTCSEMKYRAFALAWLNQSGEDFIEVIKQGDQIGLLALMWWGVFLNPLGEECWFGLEFGRDLANEVVETIGASGDLMVGELIYLAEEEFQNHEHQSEVSEPVETEREERIESKPFWEVDDPDDPETAHGNVPNSVLNYMKSQTGKMFSSEGERESFLERLRTL